VDLLKQFKNLKVSMSINTLNENFRKNMDNASPIQDRLLTLKKLHENGIYTVLFMSPIFPYITEWKEIIEISKEYVDEYWFENLNLRGNYKKVILDYIKENYNELYIKYLNIYNNKNYDYWKILSEEINQYCQKNNIKYINYFYHKELVDKKKEGKK
jgi:DNA repair photolyase